MLVNLHEDNFMFAQMFYSKSSLWAKMYKDTCNFILTFCSDIRLVDILK